MNGPLAVWLVVLLGCGRPAESTQPPQPPAEAPADAAPAAPPVTADGGPADAAAEVTSDEPVPVTIAELAAAAPGFYRIDARVAQLLGSPPRAQLVQDGARVTVELFTDTELSPQQQITALVQKTPDGLRLQRVLSGGAVEAGEYIHGPIPKPDAENRCTRDADCVLDEISCGPCGRCPGPAPAINRTYHARRVRECARSRQRSKHKRVHCSPCLYRKDEGGWPTHAVCRQGACVPAGKSTPLTLDDLDL